MDALLGVLSALLVLYLIFEIIWWATESQGITINICDRCKKIKFRWMMGKKKFNGYGYSMKCKDCLGKDRLEDELIQRKKDEYKREDELIRDHIRKPNYEKVLNSLRGR